MAITLTANTPGSNTNYEKYLSTNPVRTNRYGDSTLLDFNLAPVDSAFVPLTRGAYIVLDSALYPKWFTGFVTSEPERVYLGTDHGRVPKWEYKIEATSDDYILNLSTIGIQPAFAGKSMGYVIKALAEQQAPGFFDYTNVDDGPILANYNTTPDKRFKDIAKDFTDSANFVLWANNKKLYFKQQDYAPSCYAINGSDENFTPSQLQIRPAQNQIINDAVIVGDIEPQAYVTEYIVGNGFDASFPLLASAYGADSYVMINETFGGTSFDAQTWTVFDTPTNYLQLYNGYLNCIGGSNTGTYDVRLQSLYPIALEGVLRLTHGEFDFVPQTATSVTTGVIGGLWTANPSPSFFGCVYGIKVAYDGSSKCYIEPIANASPDSSQIFHPDTTGAKRYVIRTTTNFNHLHRHRQEIHYRTPGGTVSSVGGDSIQDVGYFTTTISEIDVVSGLLTNLVTWNNDAVPISSNQTYAEYIPVASDILHITVSGISVSSPLQATLDKAEIVPMDNLNLNSWQQNTRTIEGITNTTPNVVKITAHGYTTLDDVTIVGVQGTTGANATWPIVVVDADHFSLTGSVPSYAYSNGGVCTDISAVSNLPLSWDFTSAGTGDVSSVQDGNANLACKLKVTSVLSGHTPFVTRYVTGVLQPGTKYLVSCRVRCDSTFTSGLSIDLTDPSGVISYVAGLVVPHTSMSTSQFTSFSGVLTTPVGTVGTPLPTDMRMRVYVSDNTVTSVNSYIIVEDIVVYQDWESLLIGPNDLDSLDGAVTVATINSDSSTPITTTFTGLPVYNPGASSLVFFKDTALQTSTVPQPNELYRLTYRAAGNCYGRARDKSSISLEANQWGDNGIRAVSEYNLQPRPRNSSECELAAIATVSQDSYQHYEGTYTVWSDFSGGQPIAGTILSFSSLPTGMPPVQAEEIHEVTTTLVSKRPVERFSHQITFGEPDYTRRTLAKFANDKGSYASYVYDQQQVNQIIDVSNIADSYTADVVEPVIYSWDDYNFDIDCNQVPPSGGGFEVRSTDAGWGCDDGRNLIGRVTGGATKFSIQRQNKTRAAFIKAYDIRNQVAYSEDLTQANYSFLSGTASTMGMYLNPDNRVSQIGFVFLPGTGGGSVVGAFQVFTTNAASTGVNVSGSMSIRVDNAYVGQQITLRLVQYPSTIISSEVVTLLAGWQRYTISGIATSTNVMYLQVLNTSFGAIDMYTTRSSIEFGTLVETAYVRTLATPYGELSRFPAVVRLAFPPTNSIGAFIDSTLVIDTIQTTQIISPPSQVVPLVATSVLTADASVKSVSSVANITLTTPPIISGGVNGQYLTLLNVGTFNITFPCSTSLTGSSLATSSDIVLAPNSPCELYYTDGLGWVPSTALAVAASSVALPLYGTAGGVINVLLDVTSGIVNGAGGISVKNGSGIAFDGTGNLTLNPGVGLALSGGFIQVNTSTGLGIDGSNNVYIPGGAITASLLAALSVGSAAIQANAVGTSHIQAAAITTALIANAAITNALLGTAVVGTANIQNAAITTALIANAQIGTAQVSSLDASVITTGLLNVQMHFQGIPHGFSADTTIDNGITVLNPSFPTTNLVTIGPGSVSSLGFGHSFELRYIFPFTGAQLSLDGDTLSSSGSGFTISSSLTTPSLTVTGPPRFNTAGTGTTTPSLSACPSGSPGTPLWIEVNVNGTLAWVAAWA